jgi:hypothetical protein
LFCHRAPEFDVTKFRTKTSRVESDESKVELPDLACQPFWICHFRHGAKWLTWHHDGHNDFWLCHFGCDLVGGEDDPKLKTSNSESKVEPPDLVDLPSLPWHKVIGVA